MHSDLHSVVLPQAGGMVKCIASFQNVKFFRSASAPRPTEREQKQPSDVRRGVASDSVATPSIDASVADIPTVYPAMRGTNNAKNCHHVSGHLPSLAVHA